MTLNKQAISICKQAIRAKRCGKNCELFNLCLIKNEVKSVNLAEWVKDINRLIAGVKP